MTYGYYDPPRPDRAKGIYFFNSCNLAQQSLFNVGALLLVVTVLEFYGRQWVMRILASRRCC